MMTIILFVAVVGLLGVVFYDGFIESGVVELCNEHYQEAFDATCVPLRPQFYVGPSNFSISSLVGE